MTDRPKLHHEWRRCVALAVAYMECDSEPPHDAEFLRLRDELQEAALAWVNARAKAAEPEDEP